MFLSQIIGKFPKTLRYIFIKSGILASVKVSKPYGIVFSGGDSAPPEKIRPFIRSSSLLVAADSGYDSCLSLGVVPDVVIGDFDSIKEPIKGKHRNDIEVLTYPKDKDFSDTYLALELVQKRVGKAVLSGGSGGLMDHLFGNIALFYGTLAPALWITAKEYLFLGTEETILKGIPGQRVSVIPLEKTEIDSDGLHWELNGLELSPEKMSLSNRFRSRQVILRLLTGRALIALSYNESFLPETEL